jgi:hypothetical protein
MSEATSRFLLPHVAGTYGDAALNFIRSMLDMR